MSIQEELELREQMIVHAVEALEEAYTPGATRRDLCVGIADALEALTPTDELIEAARQRCANNKAQRQEAAR